MLRYVHFTCSAMRKDLSKLWGGDHKLPEEMSETYTPIKVHLLAIYRIFTFMYCTVKLLARDG